MLGLIGIATAYQIPIIASTITLAGSVLSGFTGALCNMFAVVFGFIFHKTISVVAKLGSNESVAFVSGDQVLTGLFIIVAGVGIGFVLMFTTKWSDKINNVQQRAS